MITVITNKKRIAELHMRFHKQLDEFLTESIHCWVGYPSGSFEDTVRYSSELDIWISHNEHENRFWNGFGVGKPIENKNNSLNGEINFSYDGSNKRIAGVFAEEDNGNVLILHRGTIGGGKPGIGKNYFISNFEGDFVTAIESNKETRFCLVGEINSSFFSRQVSIFIHEIYRIKKNINSESISSSEKLNEFEFMEEHYGRTEKERQGISIVDRTHGIIVNALAIELRKRKYEIGKDINRDIFVHKQKRINTLFEIKTNCSTQCLYAAVGQLIIYSIPIKTKVKLIIVLPGKLKKEVTDRLLELGIQPLYFKWVADLPTFIELDEIMA